MIDSNRWGHAQDFDGRFEGSCHIHVGVHGMLQTVQRAEYWGVVQALRGFTGIHFGIDNRNVLRSVAKLVDRGIEGTFFPLSKIRDAGPAFFFLALLRCSPNPVPQCLWSRKTVARPSFSMRENVHVVPKHLRTCCQAFNFQLMKCCLWFRKKQHIVGTASFFVVEILSTSLFSVPPQPPGEACGKSVGR